MKLDRIDHTAIAVRDMNEALLRYERLWGVRPSLRTTVAHQGVEVAFLPIGDTDLELICPLSENSGVARFLQRRGESLHHIGINVPDIREALASLEAEGVELIDREPREGAHGLIAFVHPRSTGGVLVELVQAEEEVAMAHTGESE